MEANSEELQNILDLKIKLEKAKNGEDVGLSVDVLKKKYEEALCGTYRIEKRVPSYGEAVQDSLTGYSGKITAYCHYYGKFPDQYLVESIDSAGRPVERWIPMERLEILHRSEE